MKSLKGYLWHKKSIANHIWGNFRRAQFSKLVKETKTVVAKQCGQVIKHVKSGVVQRSQFYDDVKGIQKRTFFLKDSIL